MAVKTITIDMEAYDLLSGHKREGQSFSDVIKAHFGPRPNVKTFKETIRKVHLSEETLDAVDRIIRDRKLSPARAVKL